MDSEAGYAQVFNDQEQSNRAAVRYLMKILTVGSNLGSAFASSILFQTPIWPVSLVIFFISSAALMLQKLEEIKAWGPLTVLFAVVIGIGLLGSAQLATVDFRPYLSIVAALLLHLTAFGFPRLHQALFPVVADDLDSTVVNHTDGSQGNVPRDSRLLYAPSDEVSYAMDADDQINRLIRDHLVSNMSHRSPSRLSQRQSENGTEIELEPPQSTSIALRRLLCLSRGIDIDEILAGGYQNTPNPREGNASRSVDCFRKEISPNIPETATATEPLPVNASISANSDSPLL